MEWKRARSRRVGQCACAISNTLYNSEEKVTGVRRQTRVLECVGVRKLGVNGRVRCWTEDYSRPRRFPWRAPLTTSHQSQNCPPPSLPCVLSREASGSWLCELLARLHPRDPTPCNTRPTGSPRWLLGHVFCVRRQLSGVYSAFGAI